MDELTERRLRGAGEIPWPLDDEPNPPPVLIEPSTGALHLASMADHEALQLAPDDRWLEGWQARKDATLHDLAVGHRASFNLGRASKRTPLIGIAILVTLAFIAGVVIGAAL